MKIVAVIAGILFLGVSVVSLSGCGDAEASGQ